MAYIDNISIHALRKERDVFPRLRMRIFDIFQSTRSARSATYTRENDFLSSVFQSTRSARSATSVRGSRHRGKEYFNPRAPQGARLLGPLFGVAL